MGQAISSTGTLRSPASAADSPFLSFQSDLSATTSSQASIPGRAQDVSSQSTDGQGSAPARCPMSPSKPVLSDEPSTAKCPMTSSNQGMNPLNNIPLDLPVTHPADARQTIVLPTQRTISSIPSSSAERWQYPSAQQFFNALVRKGWEEPQVEHVESMLTIHNWLNEDAWKLVLEWEKRQGADIERTELKRFSGRPDDLSPKAALFLRLGQWYPSRFSAEPPFDRHDWIIRRPETNKEVRYIIDYYSLPDEPDGSPAFNLDVRPALDDIESISARLGAFASRQWQKL